MLETLNKPNVKNLVLEEPREREFDLEAVRQDFSNLAAHEFSFPTWSKFLKEDIKENSIIENNLLGVLLMYKLGDVRAEDTFRALKDKWFVNGKWGHLLSGEGVFFSDSFLYSTLIEQERNPHSQSLDDLKKSQFFTGEKGLWLNTINHHRRGYTSIGYTDYLKDELFSIYVLSQYDKEDALEKYNTIKQDDTINELENELWRSEDGMVYTDTNMIGILIETTFNSHRGLELYKKLKNTKLFDGGKWLSRSTSSDFTKVLNDAHTEDALLDIWARYEIGSRLPQSLLNPVPPYPPLERV